MVLCIIINKKIKSVLFKVDKDIIFPFDVIITLWESMDYLSY